MDSAFLNPIIDDPRMMGKIACANVLSDLYAAGITNCDNMIMMLGVSTQMTEEERDVFIRRMVKGFKHNASQAHTMVRAGHGVINAWCTIASTICQPKEIIAPNNAEVGDVLALIKPLGTQVAVTAHQWIDQPERWKQLRRVVSEENVRKAYRFANRVAAGLMHKYNAHGATNINGFGLLGQAQTLATQQKNDVSFAILNFPVINKMGKVFTA